jgi:SAM-dependent methyltransferase
LGTPVFDAKTEGKGEGSFDLVFLFGFANPIGGMAPILAEAHRVLKPGGILAVEGRRGRVELQSALFAPTSQKGRVARFNRVAAIH